MMKFRTYRFLMIILSTWCIHSTVSAQEVNYDSLLQRIDTVENPVYKPVLSIGYGTLNFFGDVSNSYRWPVVGNPAVKVNVSTFIDNAHYFTADFSFLAGNLNGDQYIEGENPFNLNFTTNIFSIGVGVRYGFGHFIDEAFPVRPYLGLGIEQINFSAKGDLEDPDGNTYYYWPDGTIRSIAVGETGAALPLARDYVFETDLRSYERDRYGLGSYGSRTVGFPVSVGVRFDISERIFFRLGTSWHYTLSDYIDNVAAEGTHNAGKRGNDSYMFSQFSMHFDMFSDPKIRTEELLFADIELDPLFYDDEDGDFILDIADQCPGTPFGVVVDTVGCPLDGDSDGVPDYLDREPESPPGVWVDDDGVTLPEDKFLASLGREDALKREDLEAYMAQFRQTFKSMRVTDIPEKFVSLDTDGDEYISFDELLKVIDDYFDFKVNLSLEELRQLNEFFFEQ